jgi:protein-tyrosine phosphatase
MQVDVLPLGDDGYQIKWSQPGQYTVACEGAIPELIEQGADAAVVHLPASALAKPVFTVTNQHGGVIRVSERRVVLEGSQNFRDIGGYIGDGGRQVRWGRLFRSGRLSALTERDITRLGTLDLAVVCDFRQPSESDDHPSLLPSKKPEILDLSIDPGNLSSFFGEIISGNVAPDDVAEFMQAINQELVLDHAHRYRQMFESMLDHRGNMLIHCTAGKDRTGFGAKLILSALGVGRATIMEDYLLTNQYLPIDEEISALIEHYQHLSPAIIDPALLRPMFEVRAEYLQRAFNTVDSNFGSVGVYLRECLGLSEAAFEQLKQDYLYE